MVDSLNFKRWFTSQVLKSKCTSGGVLSIENNRALLQFIFIHKQELKTLPTLKYQKQVVTEWLPIKELKNGT